MAYKLSYSLVHTYPNLKGNVIFSTENMNPLVHSIDCSRVHSCLSFTTTKWPPNQQNFVNYIVLTWPIDYFKNMLLNFDRKSETHISSIPKMIPDGTSSQFVSLPWVQVYTSCLASRRKMNRGCKWIHLVCARKGVKQWLYSWYYRYDNCQSSELHMGYELWLLKDWGGIIYIVWCFTCLPNQCTWKCSTWNQIYWCLFFKISWQKCL